MTSMCVYIDYRRKCSINILRCNSINFFKFINIKWKTVCECDFMHNPKISKLLSCIRIYVEPYPYDLSANTYQEKLN